MFRQLDLPIRVGLYCPPGSISKRVGRSLCHRHHQPPPAAHLSSPPPPSPPTSASWAQPRDGCCSSHHSIRLRVVDNAHSVHLRQARPSGEAIVSRAGSHRFKQSQTWQAPWQVRQAPPSVSVWQPMQRLACLVPPVQGSGHLNSNLNPHFPRSMLHSNPQVSSVRAPTAQNNKRPQFKIIACRAVDASLPLQLCLTVPCGPCGLWALGWTCCI